MRLVADESVDRAVVGRLRADGHEVYWISENSPGIDDEEVLREANDRGAPLLTADKDFGELVFRQRLSHSGVILIRLPGVPNQNKAEIVSEAVQIIAEDRTITFSVISRDQIRIRRQP